MNDYDLKSLYEEMELYLIQSMQRNLGRHLKEEDEIGFKYTQWQAEKLKELKRYQRENKQIIKRYTLGLDKEISDHLQNELKEGSKKAIKDYNKILGKSLKPSKILNKSFFSLNDKKIKALIKVVNDDMKTANTSALRMINDQYRQIIYKSAFFVGHGVYTESKAAEMATNEILEKKATTLAIDEASKNFLAGGLNCIEYRDGRRVNIASYCEMAIRTASIRAHLMGEGDFRASIGQTLVKVTTHGGACPLCTKWQGKVLIDDVYSGGKQENGNYQLLSEAMEEGFLHPNCRHGVTTYYPELEELEEENSAESLQTTAEEQQYFNYAVRNAKKYQRLQEGSLDDENIKRYSRKKNEWTKIAKNLNNSPYEKTIVEARNDMTNKIQELLKETKVEKSKRKYSYYDRKNDIVHLLDDSNKYELIHEFAHAIETKLDLYHNDEFIKVLNRGLENIDINTDVEYTVFGNDNKEIMMLKKGDKFISDYQRYVYNSDIDGNGFIGDYKNYSFNSKTLGEYFSEGYRCFYENPKLLEQKDKSLYNYIKEMVD